VVGVLRLFAAPEGPRSEPRKGRRNVEPAGKGRSDLCTGRTRPSTERRITLVLLRRLRSPIAAATEPKVYRTLLSARSGPARASLSPDRANTETHQRTPGDVPARGRGDPRAEWADHGGSALPHGGGIEARGPPAPVAAVFYRGTRRPTAPTQPTVTCHVPPEGGRRGPRFF